MSSSTIQNIDKGVERFTSYDNPLIAFEFLTICVLCLFIFWRESKRDKLDKEAIEANKELAKQMAVLIELIEVIRHG